MADIAAVTQNWCFKTKRNLGYTMQTILTPRLLKSLPLNSGLLNFLKLNLPKLDMCREKEKETGRVVSQTVLVIILTVNEQ